jgi:uncharacterized protein YjiS (DUF1127 family)
MSHAEAWKSAAEPFGRVIFAAAALVTARIRQLAISFRHRHDAAILMRFDDRMLADIGLTRRDVREAFREPIWRDPTDLLVDRVARPRPARVEHDPEKWVPVFGKDHARTLRARPLTAPSIVPEIGGARAIGWPVSRF